MYAKMKMCTMQQNQLHYIKTWEAAGNAVFEPDMIIVQAYKKVFASYQPKHFLYYQKDNPNKLGEAYDSQDDMDQFSESGYIDFQDREYVTKYFKGVSQAILHNKRTIRAIEKVHAQTVSDATLATLFEQSIESMGINYSYFLACQPQRFTKLEHDIQEKLTQFVPASKVSEVFRVLSTPLLRTPIADEQIDWFKLLLRLKNERITPGDKLFLQLIQKHHKKYAILGAADGKDPWPLSHFVDKAKKTKQQVPTIERELAKLFARQEKIHVQQKYYIDTYSIPATIVTLTTLLAKVGHQRLRMRIDGWMPLYETIKALIRVIAERYNYAYDLVRFCTVDELIRLARGAPIAMRRLEQRREVFLLVYEHPETHILHGTNAEKMFATLVEKEEYGNMREVKGTVAMKGKISGRVLLFQWGDDMSEKLGSIQKGEKVVLVTGQTRPQLMPLIAKCAAIVTDEGGITSHSAIVSRELGIPCIVGTKVATRMFKDNDLIEVDAFEGIAKLIKR
jgi:phosphohistidine swiveling domain-containing protein